MEIKKIARIFFAAAVSIMLTFALAISASAMQIFVQTLAGKQITLEVEPGDSVSAIKTKISEKEGIPAAYQQLMFSSKILEDDQTLADYNINESAIIHLMLRTPSDLKVTGGTLGTDYSFANNVIEILTDTPLTISGTTTAERIEIADGVNANITLAGVNIDVSGISMAKALRIAANSTGNVTITLADGTVNVLKSAQYCAGLQKSCNYYLNGGKLIIQGESNGTGSLEAIGGESGAGIGGDFGGSCSNITISGGTVTATGGYSGAGIGGGDSGRCSNITISGGTVTATGGERGAGIGGGRYGDCSNITISGGTVTATGGDAGAGIGSDLGSSCSNITISGGSVKAESGGSGASAIGNYYEKVTPTLADGTTPVYLFTIPNPDDKPVEIDGTAYTPINHKGVDLTDGNLYAYLTGDFHTVKVGDTAARYNYNNTNNSFEEVGTAFNVTPTISGEVLAYGTDFIYPAGTGKLNILSDKAITIANVDPTTATSDWIEVLNGVNAKITLAGVNIDVSASSAPAMMIADNSTGNVTITLADGTANALKSGDNCAGLQKDCSSLSMNEGKLIIQGETNGTGSLEAIGGDLGAGIGSGDSRSCFNITISGGTVTATGGDLGAGIGSGFGGICSNITISGGAVTATGGIGGAGIGGGNDGNCSNITISGGTVTATGGIDGAGIGSANSVCSNIIISGGTVTAIGGDASAGIGGGFVGKCSNIAISGGSVKAESGKNCENAIGSYREKVTPTLADGTTPVYLLTIPNPDDKPVEIDGTAYTPINHKGVDPTDGNLYAYLTGDFHTVKVGDSETHYHFINGAFVEGERDAVYSADSNGHWYACIIEENCPIKFDYKEHSGTPATCTEYAKCTTCGRNYGSKLPHNYSTEWLSDADNHWHECVNCADKIDIAAHVSSGAPTETEDEICVVCKRVLNPSLGHVHSAHLTYVPETAASCMKNGFKAHYECTCGKLFADANALNEITSADIVIAASGKHGATEIRNKVAPTKDTAGYTGDTVCVVCGETLVRGTVIPPYGGYNPGAAATTTTAATEPDEIEPEDDAEDLGDDTLSEPENEPFIKGDNGKIGWDVILDKIGGAREGDTIDIDMNGTTELPKDILKEIKGKDITLILDMGGGFEWEINGNGVTAPRDIDMGVSKGANIPVKVINAVTGEFGYISITLEHDGEFGFKAELRVDLGKRNKGLFANLYYYLGEDKTELMGCGKIDKNGKAKLEFTHASEYVIVIDDYDHTAKSADGTDGEVITVPTDDEDGNPHTGVTLSLAAVLIAGAAAAAFRKKRM